MAGGDRDRRDRREFVGDLRCGVARTDDDDSLAGVRGRIAVVSDVRELAGERFLAREGRAVGVQNDPLAATMPDAGRLRPILGEDEEPLPVLLDRFYAVLVWVSTSSSAGVLLRGSRSPHRGPGSGRRTGERHAWHRAVSSRREHPQAVVVARPRSGWAIAGLEDHRRHPQLAQSSSGRQTRLAGTHDDHGGKRAGISGVTPRSSMHVYQHWPSRASSVPRAGKRGQRRGL